MHLGHTPSVEKKWRVINTAATKQIKTQQPCQARHTNKAHLAAPAGLLRKEASISESCSDNAPERVEVNPENDRWDYRVERCK